MKSNFEIEILFFFFKMQFGVSVLSEVLLFPLSELKHAQQGHRL